MTNIQRIFREKDDTKFKDKYGGVTFTVKELNEGFLKPTMQINPNPEGEEMIEIEKWFERYEKI